MDRFAIADRTTPEHSGIARHEDVASRGCGAEGRSCSACRANAAREHQVGDKNRRRQLEACRDADREAAGTRGGVAAEVKQHQRDDREVNLADSLKPGAGRDTRDRGVGFDLDAIPADRRGVRDSIIARMARHDGRAAVKSSPGAGTEVELVMERAAST